MKNKNKKQKTVVIGLSGGVDSSVAALLLKKQGYRVIGAFMKNFSDTKNNITGECLWVAEKKEAEKAASVLQIPLVVFDFEKEYKNLVIKKMIESYRNGLTPNPDVLCNKLIKFPLFWKEAKKLGADYIAMGHYIISKKVGKNYELFIPKDKNKDQSYFLFELTQKDLEHTLFPIGNYTKEEVRQIAKSSGLQNWDKKGTSGICFVGKVDVKQFLKKQIKPRIGNLISTDGKIVGTHEGIMYYTIGERIADKSGIKVNKEFRNKIKEKLYIVSKNKQKNEIVIAPEKNKFSKRNEFQIKKLNWINKKPSFPINNIKVRIRHLGSLVSATIISKNNKLICKLKSGVKGIADGQNVVIYKNKQLLGGGEIRF